MILHFFAVIAMSALTDDLKDADADTMAQAFMERCIDQDGDEKKCRKETISMFGTSGLTDIDVSLSSKKGDSEDTGFFQIFHKGRKDKRSVSCARSQCIAPNTIYYGGMCRCRVFYDYGSPIGKGCWRCKPSCNSNAVCTQNDGCVCKNFTVGDGYRKCDIHIPTIIRSYSKSDLRTVFVEIEPVSWGFPNDAYCKFYNFILKGRLISNNTIQCVRKTTIKKDTKVDVSWDGVAFSHQKMEIGRRNDVEGEIGPVIIGIIVIFLAICIYFLLLYQRGSTSGDSFEQYAAKATAVGKL